MASCPFCNAVYEGYAIVGVYPASEHLTDWLDPIPVAQLFCRDCGRYTFMHPDHPDVQRMPKARAFEEVGENVRTLNVPLEDVGDEELRVQFERGAER